MIEIACPSLEQINACWDEISPLIQRACDHSNGELSTDVILRCINEGSLMLVVVYEDKKLTAAVTFEQTNFETGKRVMNIQVAAGDNVDAWFHQIEQLAESLAKRYQCDDIYIIGRKGWAKKMKHLGYSEVHTILHREVK